MMEEQKLNFSRNEDPTIVKDPDGKILKEVTKIYKNLQLNLGFCHEQLKEGKLTDIKIKLRYQERSCCRLMKLKKEHSKLELTNQYEAENHAKLSVSYAHHIAMRMLTESNQLNIIKELETELNKV